MHTAKSQFQNLSPQNINKCKIKIRKINSYSILNYLVLPTKSKIILLQYDYNFIEVCKTETLLW